MRHQSVKSVCHYHEPCECRQVSTASAYETALVCGCVEAWCVAEDDGFHEHCYLVGGPIVHPARVILSLHTWMPEWHADHPGKGPVEVENPGGNATGNYPTVADAFAALNLPCPEVPCDLPQEAQR